MLIFDSFPTRDLAQAFGFHAQDRFGLNAYVHFSQDSADEVDPFPFELKPPIVLVERLYDQPQQRTVEALLRKHVKRFRGRFAGT